jgi:hypothetical protein
MDYALASPNIRHYDACVICGTLKVHFAVADAHGEVGCCGFWEQGGDLQAVTQLGAEDGTSRDDMVGQHLQTSPRRGVRWQVIVKK